MKIKILIFTGIFVFGLLFGYFVRGFSDITGNVALEDNEEVKNYSWTTAICNYDSKECIDVFVECSGQDVVGLTPVSHLIYFGDNWSDIRNYSVEYCK